MFKERVLPGIKQNAKSLVIFGALIVLILVGGLVNASFLTVNHLMDIMYLNTMFGLLAISQTIVILSGGIDMSIGAIYWCTIMMGAQYMRGGNLVTGVLYVLAVGLAAGLVNGICIAKLKIPYVVTTLAMMMILTGVLYVVTGGGGNGTAAQQLHDFSIARLPALGKMRGIPYRVIMWILFLAIMSFILNRTTFGWTVRALGANPIAARFNGLKADQTQVLVYVVSAFFAVVAGLMYLGQAGSPSPSFEGGVGVGTAITMDTIAAVIVGGTFFSGGKGGFWNTLMGVLIISMLSSLLSMAGLDSNIRTIINGMIMLIVVAIYSSDKK